VSLQIEEKAIMTTGRLFQIPVILAAAATVGISSVAMPASAADGVLTLHRISAVLANEAVGAAVAACASQGYGETAVVVDSDGVVQAVLRGDGVGAHTLDSAHDKAFTAASFKSDTMALVARTSGQPPSPLYAKLPHLLLFAGGVVIKIGNEVVGAIGAAGAPGGNLDDGCAKAGLAKIADQLK
jgi:uncharacterized protein GlcG (DUF336 family)